MSEEAIWVSDINFIVVGLENHSKLLSALFGGGTSDSSPSSAQKQKQKPTTSLTPKTFDAVFGRKGKTK